ncbi:hypothetical protein [Lentzea sp. NPDC055074]
MPEQPEAETETTAAFAELRRNLDYARDLVRGGRHLERLQVGAFDVADLYRAAWVQAVSALDHWVHRELYDRASAFASSFSANRPAKFLRIEVPMSLLEAVLHGTAVMEDVFRTHLRAQYGYLSFQNPDKIKYAFSFVSDVSLWPGVAAQLGPGHTPKSVQDQLNAIVKRRNRIAHETDRDHEAGGVRTPIADKEVTDTIDWLETMAGAIFAVIGPPPSFTAPTAANEEAKQKTKARWSRQDVNDAIEATSSTPARVAAEKLLGHADANNALFKGGVSTEPAAGLYYWLQGKRRSLWSLYVTAERPVITVNLNSIWSKDPHLAHLMVAKLRTQPTLDAALLYDDDVVVQKYPAIELAALGESDSTIATVLDVLDLAIAHQTKHEAIDMA